MGKFDLDYYLIVRPRQDDQSRDLFPDLGADEDTADLPFRYQRLPMGSRPLKFTNVGQEFRKKHGMTTIKHPPDVLFDGSNPLVRGKVREKLLAMDLPSLELQPAIFVDDWGKWHEDYWYLTFTDRLDCWDRQTSDYERGSPLRIAGESLYQLYDIQLDEKVIEDTPLSERLLFQLGGAIDAVVLAHKSVAGLFRGADGKSGAQVISLPDFPDLY